jgi:murein DD-endopeptidase MepM/ murein hydrolase activator NlpD
MKKKAAHEDRRSGGILVAVALFAGFSGLDAKAAAALDTRWPRPTYFTVVARPGDTVGSLSARFRVSTSRIANLNHLLSDSHIPTGRILRIPAVARATREAVLFEALDKSAPNYAKPPIFPVLRRNPIPPRSLAEATPGTISPARLETKSARANAGAVVQFSWPIAGPVISAFGPGEHGSRNDGINIAVKQGAPFRAAAGGSVSYAGSLRGYGNLILISHPDGFVTAYAHAENIKVERGERVGRGEVIGQAGNTGGVDRPQLHFEIRHGTKAIDPSILLAANS